MILYYFISITLISVLIYFLRNRTFNMYLSGLFLIVQTIFCGGVFSHLGEKDSIYFLLDNTGAILTGVLTILSFATFYHSILYLKRHGKSAKTESVYYAALIMLIASMTGAYFSDNLGLMWAFIEATTLFVSMLIYYDRTNIALEAAWKYLFICSIGIAIAFIGIIFLGMMTSQQGIADLSISGMLVQTQHLDLMWLKVTFLLIVTGFSAKMGVFPLYTVCIDAHTAAPPPISAFISTTLMNVGFVGIFRIYSIVAQTDAVGWARNVLIISGLLSIAIASIHLLKVKHYKRMFAFSSLEHMGIILLALAAGGIGYYAAILHIVLHSFAKATLFYQIGQVSSVFHSYWIKGTGKYLQINPLGAMVVILALLCISGVPPSGLFVSEYLAFKALFINTNIIIPVSALALMTIVLLVFAKNLLHLLYGEQEEVVHSHPVKINWTENISQFVLIGLIIYFGYFPPQSFVELIQGSVSVFGK